MISGEGGLGNSGNSVGDPGGKGLCIDAIALAPSSLCIGSLLFVVGVLRDLCLCSQEVSSCFRFDWMGCSGQDPVMMSRSQGVDKIDFFRDCSVWV